MRSRLAAALLCHALLGVAAPASARVLEVGAGRAYALPSNAAAVAQDGDMVDIAAGEYFDCAVWGVSRLVISGPEPPAVAVLTDRACEGKAAFVVKGAAVTVRNLGFARIRVADGNGAGIRAEAPGLTVIGSRFVNTQVAILNGAAGGTLRISGSAFEATGAGSGLPAVIAGSVALLRIEGSRFVGPRGGSFLSSTADFTQLVGNRLDDGAGRARLPLARIASATVLLERNTVALGDGTDGDGVFLLTGSTGTLSVRGNTLAGGHAPLVRNWSGADAQEADNVVPQGVEAVSDSGASYHRLRAHAAGARDWAKELAKDAKHGVAEAARWLGLLH